MIWLASYPRSGNTFFRIVLHEVYGIESSTFHLESRYPMDPGYDKYPVVKTHLLPGQLVPGDPDIPAVYIVRDGRDALVSMANQRVDLIDADSDFRQNLAEAILAEDGSHFGGWSCNVSEWLKRAAVVIRFEDLIRDPVRSIERIRPLLDLPGPDLSRVPTFSDLKSREFKYGSGIEHGFSKDKRKKMLDRNFRRGKVGSWRDEMPDDLHRLFWKRHGAAMKALGYRKPLISAVKWKLQDVMDGIRER